jgi:type IV secretion system protein VirB10
MSDPLEAAGSPPPKQAPEAFALRGRPQPVVRFRRGVIVGATGAVAAAIVTVSWFALQPPGFHKAVTAIESDDPASRAGADAVANAPRSYGDVPRLGPPLPGDLGRPVLEDERGIGSAPPAERATSVAEKGRRRIAEARQAARSSPVMVELAQGGGAERAEGHATAHPDNPIQDAAPMSAATGAGQQHKIDFARPAKDGDFNPNGLVAAPSPWTLSAGTIIPASLITGLNSDLPGIVLAQVTANVRDAATGRTILIPQGARLIGNYDSVVAYGQRRALLVWTRILMPDGSSVQLDNMPATDTSGYAGLEGKVDSHTWQLLKGIALSTLLGVGTQLSLGSSESDLVRAIRESTQQNAAQAGDRITSRNLDLQPTIEVRPGWPVRAIVNKDFVLRPWRG